MAKTSLVNIPGCYSYELQKEINTIRAMTDSNNYSAVDLKAFVHTVASRANVTAAQKNFIRNLLAKNYKKDILYYCENVIASAARYYVTVN